MRTATSPTVRVSRFPEPLYAASRRAWEDFLSKDTDRKTQGFRYPSYAEFVPILTAAMDATLATEEKRAVRFRMLFSPSLPLLESWGKRSGLANPWFLTRLHPPLPLSSSSIRSLAPAFDEYDSYLIATPSESAGGDRLEIAGVLTGARGMLLMREGTAFHCIGGPCSPGFAAVGVGRIAITSEEFSLCEVGMDGLTLSGYGNTQRLPKEIYDFSLSGAAELERQVRSVFRSLGEADARTASEGHFQACLGEILSRINRARHGGTVLMLDSDYDSADERLRDVVKIKHMAPQTRLWDALTNMWGASLADGKRNSFGEANSAVTDAVRFIAGLANIDGAVVLNTRLVVMGFGAEVRVSAPSFTSVDRVRCDGSIECLQIESFGTRHRSAARFASAVERSAAFVVSSDGGVRAFHRVGPRVRMWDSVNFARY